MTGVEMLRWPAEAGRRDELAARGLPRLLLVPAGVSPPPLGAGEDWIRVPASEQDVWARLQRLTALHIGRRPGPQLADSLLLVCGDRSVALTEADAAVLRPLLDHFGRLVRWDELVATAWPDGAGTVRRARARTTRLRRLLAPLGLAIHTVRGAGVLLDHHLAPTRADP